MSKIVIEKSDFKNDVVINTKLHDLLDKIDVSNIIWIFDIHNTVEHDGKVDKNFLKLITHLIKMKYIVLMLSYDGNAARIDENEAILNKEDVFKNIPKIFIKIRDKGRVIKSISNIYKTSKIVFIDDKRANITSARNQVGDNLYAIHYKGDFRHLLDKLSHIGHKFE
ncbi:MAG: hypothetical protein Faunusvirus1_63 [Faunusvirus sp.]|jgi:hypothetical protein|uniref:Uncharacterized protein n=1 Tax=Faunusvirus sp. TaxID=2487766 RepID=A0A3G4ZZN5_9VIRU|nr:MAG: hypothetical protein Faunusvirus1_63 [Faunusvirus sp.]